MRNGFPSRMMVEDCIKRLSATTNSSLEVETTRKSQRKIFLELFLHQAPTPLSMWAAKRQ